MVLSCKPCKIIIWNALKFYSEILENFFCKIPPSHYFIFISSKVGDRDFNFDLPPFNRSTNPSASFSSCSSKSSSHSALESVKPKGLPRLAMRKLSASLSASPIVETPVAGDGWIIIIIIMSYHRHLLGQSS